MSMDRITSSHATKNSVSLDQGDESSLNDRSTPIEKLSWYWKCCCRLSVQVVVTMQIYAMDSPSSHPEEPMKVPFG